MADSTGFSLNNKLNAIAKGQRSCYPASLVTIVTSSVYVTSRLQCRPAGFVTFDMVHKNITTNRQIKNLHSEILNTMYRIICFVFNSHFP